MSFQLRATSDFVLNLAHSADNWNFAMLRKHRQLAAVIRTAFKYIYIHIYLLFKCSTLVKPTTLPLITQCWPPAADFRSPLLTHRLPIADYWGLPITRRHTLLTTEAHCSPAYPHRWISWLPKLTLWHPPLSTADTGVRCSHAAKYHWLPELTTHPSTSTADYRQPPESCDSQPQLLVGEKWTPIVSWTQCLVLYI